MDGNQEDPVSIGARHITPSIMNIKFNTQKPRCEIAGTSLPAAADQAQQCHVMAGMAVESKVTFTVCSMFIMTLF